MKQNKNLMKPGVKLSIKYNMVEIYHIRNLSLIKILRNFTLNFQRNLYRCLKMKKKNLNSPLKPKTIKDFIKIHITKIMCHIKDKVRK